MGKSTMFCMIAILLCAGFLFIVATSTLGQGSNNCMTPVPTILLNVEKTGTTDDPSITNNHDCGRGHMGPDVVYQFTISGSSKDVTFDGVANFDADWTLSTTCESEEQVTTGDLGCWDMAIEAGPPPTPSGYGNKWGELWLTLELEPGTYYIWIDGNYPEAKGDYILTLHNYTLTPTVTATETPPPTDTPTSCATYTPTPTPTPS